MVNGELMKIIKLEAHPQLPTLFSTLGRCHESQRSHMAENVIGCFSVNTSVRPNFL